MSTKTLSVGDNPFPELMTVPEMARKLHISRSSAYLLVTDGEIPCFVMAGRKLVRVDDALRYLHAHYRQSNTGDRPEAAVPVAA